MDSRKGLIYILLISACLIFSLYLVDRQYSQHPDGTEAGTGGNGSGGNNIVGHDKITESVSPDWNITPSRRIAGVSVYEKIPYSMLSLDGLTLYQAMGPAELTCNFELGALTVNQGGGYGVLLENGLQGIYLEESYARVRGNSDEELLESCHAFVCFMENISCPDNLSRIGDIVTRNNVSYLVIENDTGPGAGMGYLEIMGALGFLQAQIADSDGDGKLTETEIDANTWYIMPYVKSGNVCRHMPVTNGVQEPEAVDIDPLTEACRFPSGIFISSSDNNALTIEKGSIYITGDDDHIRKIAVIVRDIISPEWIRAYNRAL